jgi:transposase
MIADSPSTYRKETAREFKRRRAVELIQEGEWPSVIARFLGVSACSVQRWYDQFLSSGHLEVKKPSGRPRKLSSEQIEVLRELLARGAVANGWHNELWTSDRVAVVIRKRFKVAYSHSSAWRVLKDYLGWTAQKPVQRLAERNEAAINRWREVEFPRILKEVEQKRAYLVFIDEAGFLLSPNVRRTYSPRGQKPVIKTGDPHARISAIGALSISPKRRRHYFLHHLLHDNANFHSDTVVAFVRDVNRRLSGPMIILCDAFRIHCSKLMSAYLKCHPRVEIEEFPPCAPELNPVDKAWAYLKHNRLANYIPRNLVEMRRRLESEFREVRLKQNVLRKCVREAGLGSALSKRGFEAHSAD